MKLLFFTIILLDASDIQRHQPHMERELTDVESGFKEALLKQLLWKPKEVGSWEPKKHTNQTTLLDFIDSNGFLDEYFEYYFVV